MLKSPQSTWMCCIIQVDFPLQMSVFRWLVHDRQYRCVWIYHDRDIAEDDRVRVFPDGTEQQINKGDLKPIHIHMIIKLPRRMTAESFSKRFGNYVQFQVCADPAEYARYFLHKTFDSQDKVEYFPDCVCGDSTLYCELTAIRQDDDICGNVNTFIRLVDLCGDFNSAVQQICSAGDAPLLKSVMSHAYFYNSLFKGV